MAKSIIDKDELKKAKTSLEQARNMLINDGSCIITKLNGVQSRLRGSDIWDGPACDVFTSKLGSEINELLKLDKTLVSLISHIGKVDGDLESYVRYVQSLFGHKF